MHKLSYLFGGVLLLACSCPAGEALLIDGVAADCEPLRFRFERTTREARFVEANGEALDFEAGSLVRWGVPVLPPSRGPSLLLSDGSLVVADPYWGDDGPLTFDEASLSFRAGGGWRRIERARVCGVDLGDDARFSFDRDHPDAKDTLHLSDGDLLSGEVVSCDGESIKMVAFGQEVETPIERVDSIGFTSTAQRRGDPGCWVGFRNGTLVLARRLEVSADDVRVECSGGLELRSPTGELVFLQPLGGRIEYLSDLEPLNYQHTPFFDLEWPYAADRGLDDPLMISRGELCVKGVATHSAARLVYRLDGSHERLQSRVGLADSQRSTRGAGSVQFLLYLVREGALEPAFNSGVMRSGDPLQAIDLDLTGATALVLVVDYADRGDAGDHALWLDARLVSR